MQVRCNQILYLQTTISDTEEDDSPTTTALMNLSSFTEYLLFTCDPHITIQSWNVPVNHELQNLKEKREAKSVKEWSQSWCRPKAFFQFRINTSLFVLLTGLLPLLLLPAISWLFQYFIPGLLSTVFDLSLAYAWHSYKSVFNIIASHGPLFPFLSPPIMLSFYSWCVSQG